jgi:hypothetical protein
MNAFNRPCGECWVSSTVKIIRQHLSSRRYLTASIFALARLELISITQAGFPSL